MTTIETHGWDGKFLSREEKCNQAGLIVSRLIGAQVSWRMLKNRFEARWTIVEDGWDGCNFGKVERTCFAVWDNTPVRPGLDVPCTYGLPRGWELPYHLFD
jgi:hypothetical protein